MIVGLSLLCLHYILTERLTQSRCTSSRIRMETKPWVLWIRFWRSVVFHHLLLHHRVLWYELFPIHILPMLLAAWGRLWGCPRPFIPTQGVIYGVATFSGGLLNCSSWTTSTNHTLHSITLPYFALNFFSLLMHLIINNTWLIVLNKKKKN